MTLRIRQSTSATGSTNYWPETEALRGGIVCLHGSEGGSAGWNDRNCVLLAAHGFAAMAHNYSQNARWLTHPDIENVPLEGAAAALAALRAELTNRNCGVGLFGSSRGAEHALLLAQLLAEDEHLDLPEAIAVHSPPDQAWPAFIVADFQTGQPWAGDPHRSAWSWCGSCDRTRPGTLLGTQATYPLFISQGAADEVWDAEMARRLVARIVGAGGQPEAYFFEGEGHVFSAKASNREWDLMVDFFSRHLQPGE